MNLLSVPYTVIPYGKDSVSTLKWSNLIKFQFSHVFCRTRSFFPGAGVFFAGAGGEKPGVCTALIVWHKLSQRQNGIGNSSVWLNFAWNTKNKFHHNSPKEHLKICNITNFKMLFLAVVIYFIHIAWMKISPNAGIAYLCMVNKANANPRVENSPSHWPLRQAKYSVFK